MADKIPAVGGVSTVVSFVLVVCALNGLKGCMDHSRENARRIELQREQTQGAQQPVTSPIVPAGVSADKAARCESNKPTFANWISEEKDCAGTSLTPPLLCGVHDKESGMCMGTEAKEKCDESSAGAGGPWQFMPTTFYGDSRMVEVMVKGKKETKKVWIQGVGFDGDGNGKTDINGFVDAGKSAVRYLCRLEKKVGSTDFLRAYNGGIEGYKKAVTATTAYDQWIREKALTYSGASGNGPVLAQTATPSAAANRSSGSKEPLTIEAVGFPGKRLLLGRRLRIAYPIAIGDGCITSIEGEDRPGHKHKGVDTAAENGIPVFASADGVVRYAGWHHDGKNEKGQDNPGESAGIHVRIEYNGDTKTPGTLAYSGAMHLNKAAVSTGQRVVQGQLIGEVGRTGVHNSGSHLHYQMEKWTANGGTELVDNPADFLNYSAFDPSSSLYRGPDTNSCRAYGDKFRKFIALN